MSQRRWICPKCAVVKRTSTGVTSTYCVACSAWFDLIGEVNDDGITMRSEKIGDVVVEEIVDETHIRPPGGWN